MKKKIVHVLICMLFLTSIFASSAIAINIISNTKHINGNVTKSVFNEQDILELRIEVQEIGYRQFDVRIYLKNTWDEQIKVTPNPWVWNEHFLSFHVYHIEQDVWVHGVHIRCNDDIILEANEDKLMYKTIWKGIANDYHWFKHRILPEGNYSLYAFLGRYRVNDFYDCEGDDCFVNIYLPAPKPRVRNLIIFDYLEHFPFLEKLLA